MTDQPKPKSIEEQQAQKRLDELNPLARSIVMDQWRRLREIREAPEDPTKGSWI